MKDRIGFVAVGQAGGNIGRLFEDKGYSVLYLNTSDEDLETIDGVHKYHISGGEGCNKDRDKAKQLVVDDFDNIAERIDETVSAELLFVIFASGGGTGSGAGPMLSDLLIDDSRNVGIITVIPSESESIKSQINSYYCFNEIFTIEQTAALFVLDNNKGERRELNEKFVNAFDSFVEIPQKYKSENGNIDKAEVFESLNSHGMAIVVRSAKNDMAELVAQIDSGVFAIPEHDKAVKYISCACSAGIKDFSDIKKAAGNPFDEFRAYSDDEAVLLLSGLSFPLTRINTIHELIIANKESIINSTSIKNVQLKNDFDFLSKKVNVPQAKSQPKSRREILAKYLNK